MRLTTQQIDGIREIVQRLAGEQAELRLFGSRLDDSARGGDVDIFVELPNPVTEPAWLAARIGGEVSRLMHGRKVDVLLAAPNLKNLPIHDIARQQGQRL